ncbi:MAG: hypothetical protein WB440_20130 [Steroidobacteraceae bacterium]|jgi:uncharacterized lipoprotein
MSIIRSLTCAAAMTLLAGCHISHWFAVDCHAPQEYQHASEVAPLKVPPGLDSPNTQGALVIPDVGLVAPPPGRKDPCLDAPPRYKAAPSNKAGG